MTGAVTNEPEYSIEEDDNFIKITIPAPLSRPDSAAVLLEGNVLTFDTHPYLLKLKLPSKVLDDYSHVKFDGQNGIYIVRLKKDLSGNGALEEDEDDESQCEESELLLEGLGDEKLNEKHGIGNQFYGFGNLYSKMFGQHCDEFSDVIDVPDPDKTDPKERTNLRNEDEKKKWDIDHYLADTMEPETCDVNSYLNYNPFWDRTPLRDELSDDEKEVLLENLTRKDWMKSELADETRKICELQMIDILFAYAYNKRVTEGDNTVTSAWNITKLSASLSWFEVFKNVKEVLISCYKRCLTYPLCRNWDLAEAVKKDVALILNLGPKIITRCFLEIRDIFNETDNYYVLNTLYINDLAHFAYSLDKEKTAELSREVEMELTKCDVNIELPLIEVAAYLVLNQENNKNENEEVDMSIVIERLAKLGMKSLNINKFSGSGSESSDSSTTEESYEIPEGNNDLPEESDDDSSEGEEEESSDDDFASDESDDDEEEEEEAEEEEEWESCEEEEEDEDEEDDNQ